VRIPLPHDGYRKLKERAGGGIIGCSCAYFLTRHPAYDGSKHSITILEATKVAGGSSGKAGGLLQIEAEPACLAPLSFKLHSDLADEHDGRSVWGYRNVYVGECDLRSEETSGRSACETRDPSRNDTTYPEALKWILPSAIQTYKQVGVPANSAQVHPYLFTTSIARLAEEAGAMVIEGTAITINHTPGGEKVESVSYRPRNRRGGQCRVLPATDIVVAAGPWASTIIPSASIGGAKSHSIVIRPSNPLSDNCLWANIKGRKSNGLSTDIDLELYCRPDGTLYSCEWADLHATLPSTSDRIDVDENRCQEMQDALAIVSNELRDGELCVKQACYQPVILRNGNRAKNAGPLLGSTGVEGVLLACGHDSWGIQNAPGTGLVISEMIFERGVKSADVRSLDPRIILGQSKLL
jgi:glycine/D-amino acid oxidase-like deaminating enzyme